MLLMIESGIRGGMCQAIHKYAKENNKYMKNFNKNIPSTYLQNLDVSNLYGWAMCKTLPADVFKWIDDLFTFDENSIKTYDENSDIEYFFEVAIEYSKGLFSKHKINIYHFYLTEKK